MKLDLLKYVMENILHRKLRSWLTVLSILIGIMAIFALISFGVGVQGYVGSLAEEMGANKLVVQPKGFSAPGTSNVVFSEDNIRAVENIKQVDLVTGVMFFAVNIKDDLDTVGKWVFASGLPEDKKEQDVYFEVSTQDILMGRSLRPNDKHKVVLGYSYLKDDKIFEKAVKLHDKIYINDIEFRVVGFFDSLGSPDDDKTALISIDAAREISDSEDYNYLYVKVIEGKDMDDVQESVEKVLRRDRDQKEGEEDFFVQTFEDALAMFTNILSILNAVLVLIALISVVVSAVNITNAMYTSVLERTKEIGIMKAIGAKNVTIQTIFLLEAGFLGFMGGAVGVFFGYLISNTAGKIAADAGYGLLRPAFPIWLIAGCLIFSFLVGMLSGYFPARGASKLRPVDSLRYE